MFILGNILKGLGKVIELGLDFYMIVLIGRVIVSWVGGDPYNPIVRFLVRATEPVLRRLRRWFPRLANLNGLDLTPLIVVAIVIFLQYAVAETVMQLGAIVARM